MSFTQMAINHQAKFSPAQHNNELKGFYHIKFSIAQTSYFGKYWGVVKLVLVGRAKKKPKSENFVLNVCSLGPRGDPHMRP